MATLAETQPAFPAPADDTEASLYLTDGLRLFRLVRGASWPPEATYAVLEDCYTLEARPYSVEELAGMQLSVVQEPGRTADRALSGL